MRAEVANLGKRKYYGTVVDIAHDDGSTDQVTIWVMGDRRPSVRQLGVWGYETPEEARADDMLSDSHYETGISLELARLLANHINRSRHK